MKIRIGYVSNSSSTSFVIIGKLIYDPLERIRAGARVMAVGYSCGRSGDVADWCMELDENSYNVLTSSEWFKNLIDDFNFYEVFCSGIDESDVSIPEKTNGRIFIIERDSTSCHNIKELKEFLSEM